MINSRQLNGRFRIACEAKRTTEIIVITTTCGRMVAGAHNQREVDIILHVCCSGDLLP